MISGGAPVAFRRCYYDATFYFDDSNVLQCRDGQGQPIPWLALGSATADAGPAQMQFGFSVDCSFDDLVSPAEMRDLFSQYKFGKTEFQLTFEMGDSTSTAAGTNNYATQSAGPPHVYYYYDSTNADPSTNVVDVMQRGNVKSHLLTNNHPLIFNHTLRPQLGAADGQLAYAPLVVLDQNPWLKLTRPNGDDGNAAPFYGTHFYVRNFGGSFTGARMRLTAIQNLYLRYPR